MTAQAELLAWYGATARDLPWRRTRDPYRVLVSEVMLQQTQVDRVVPFYERFIERFPDERALAAASREDLHRLWKGLGYPNRVERLQAACVAVLALGAWPETPAGLRELPGIGPYTAGAVACFAFAQPVAVVDTNVARVYARRDGLALPLDRDGLWAHAAAEVDARDPIAYTNALMDLGSTVCTARKAHCGSCPWSARCASRDALAIQAATSNPLKVASPRHAYGVAVTDRTRPRRHIALALVHDQDRYLVARRLPDAHLGGWWEIPGGKREAGEDDRTTVARELREEVGLELLAARHLVDFSHDYGDRYLSFHCYRCKVFDASLARPLASSELRWVTPRELVELELPPANAPLIERLRRYHRLR